MSVDFPTWVGFRRVLKEILDWSRELYGTGIGIATVAENKHINPCEVAASNHDIQIDVFNCSIFVLKVVWWFSCEYDGYVMVTIDKPSSFLKHGSSIGDLPAPHFFNTELLCPFSAIIVFDPHYGLGWTSTMRLKSRRYGFIALITAIVLCAS